GAVTATASDVASAFATSSATSLVTIAATGTGVAAGTAAATALTGGSNAQLSLKSENYGSKEFASVNVLAGTFATKDANNSNTAATRSTGADVTAIINGQLATGSGLNASIHTATLDAQVSLDATNGNVVNSTSTITVTGGGALFQIGQDVSVNGQIGLGIQAVNTARLGGVDGKLYQLGTGGGKSLQDVGPNVQGSTLVNIINEAMNKVSTLRGTLGAIQSDVIQTNVDSLGVALDNITQAKSSIDDTDFAAETANLTKDQILSQASMTVLGIANQQPNQVLNLLRG
ncbi:MAG TPA: flagellin, partial [Planctomycetaceae bacterium]|nr:flagellin [Planctomycetaceae bacterium]